FGDEVGAEHPDAVAAHLGGAAVGVGVVHEPFGARVVGEHSSTLGQLRGTHRADDAVAPDAEAAIREGGELRVREGHLTVGVGEQHEVVAGSVSLGEGDVDGHRSMLSGGVAPRLDPRCRVGGHDARHTAETKPHSPAPRNSPPMPLPAQVNPNWASPASSITPKPVVPDFRKTVNVGPDWRMSNSTTGIEATRVSGANAPPASVPMWHSMTSADGPAGYSAWIEVHETDTRYLPGPRGACRAVLGAPPPALTVEKLTAEISASSPAGPDGPVAPLA